MKTSTILSVITAFALSIMVGCGLQTEDGTTNPPPATDADADTTPSPKADVGIYDSFIGTDAGTTVASLPDPFKSPAPCMFDVSSRYVSGATSGELRGNLPLNTWTQGMKVLDSDGSGYMGLKFESAMPAGTYSFSYVGYQGSSMVEAWAQYGLAADIMQMSAAGRAYLLCNWYDAATSSMLTVAQPNCKIMVAIDSACNITPAGNMANFAAK